jgi:hypothetical protein
VEILSKNGGQYRTRLMTQEHAEQFAACLRANSLFDGVMVYESPTAKTERRHYVVYHPSDPDACAAILQRQQQKRADKARAEAQDYLFVRDDQTGRFYWCMSASGEVYEVTDFSCTCPDFEYRCREAGVHCKHQVALADLTEREHALAA